MQIKEIEPPVLTPKITKARSLYIKPTLQIISVKNTEGKPDSTGPEGHAPGTVNQSPS